MSANRRAVFDEAIERCARCVVLLGAAQVQCERNAEGASNAAYNETMQLRMAKDELMSVSSIINALLKTDAA